jgi:4-amino-4-deoxy-L-arabinose transferase-like glycosyltransferase
MAAPIPRWLTHWPYLRVYLLPALLVVAIGLFRLFGGSYKVDTALYAGVGLHMFNEGTFWTPMAGDLPYFNKPPMVMWIHGLLLSMFGVELWAIRLPQVLAAAGCAVMTTCLARTLSNHKVALLAGLIAAICYPMWIHLHRLVLDYWLVFFTLTGVWMCVVGAVRRQEGWIILAGVPIGMAMLCKPLFPGLAFPIMGLWMALVGHRKMAAWVGVGAGLSLLVALPWHLSMTAIHQDTFLDQFFGREMFDRGAGGGAFPHEPWWTYLAIVTVQFLPWTVALGGALWVIGGRLVRSRGRCVLEGSTYPDAPPAAEVPDYSRVRADLYLPPERVLPLDLEQKATLSREWQAIILCVLWAGLWLFLLSGFFADKRDRYMMHVWPMLAWLAAMWLVHWAPYRIRAIDSRWWGRGVGAMLVLGLLAAATGAIPQSPTQSKWLSLYRWLESQRMAGHAPEVWSGSLQPYETGQIYLDAGVWPSAIWHGGAADPRIPPEDAIVIFERDRLENLAELVGRPIEPVFESGPDREYGDARALVAIRWQPSWNLTLHGAPRGVVGPRP